MKDKRLNRSTGSEFEKSKWKVTSHFILLVVHPLSLSRSASPACKHQHPVSQNWRSKRIKDRRSCTGDLQVRIVSLLCGGLAPRTETVYEGAARPIFGLPMFQRMIMLAYKVAIATSDAYNLRAASAEPSNQVGHQQAGKHSYLTTRLKHRLEGVSVGWIATCDFLG